MKWLAIFLLTIFSSPLFSSLNLFGGPEIYHISRARFGGTHQGGRMDGIRFGANYCFCSNWYLGTEILLATGELDGLSSQLAPLKSDLTDHIYELRIGYSFQRADRSSCFTPFVGAGYFCETNDFFHPSPVHYQFDDSFEYVAVGFFAFRNFSCLVSMGLNFKAAFMINGRSEISRDPLHGRVTLDMERELQLRVEVPLYSALATNRAPCVEIAPFYEYRHFGGKESFPFDFIDTQFQIFGIRFAVNYEF